MAEKRTQPTARTVLPSVVSFEALDVDSGVTLAPIV